MAKNTFTRLGRPPTVAAPPKNQRSASGEPQKPSPSSTFKAAVPGKAYRAGGSVNGFKRMPRYRDNC